MRLLIIANQAAGSGKAARFTDKLRNAASARRMDVEVLLPKSAVEATNSVASADLDHFDAVIAAGGDGTLFRVLNGLMRNPQSRPLGVIPMGTGNAFSRDIGLAAGDLDSALDIIARGKSRAVDIGEVLCRDEEFYFINIVGLGFAADAGITAASLKFAGPVSYTLAALWNILTLNSRMLDFSLDGVGHHSDTVMLELSNSRFTGTDFLIAPEARIDDGLLDMTLLKQLSRARLIRLFPTIYRGQHVHFDEVDTARVRKVEILSPEGMPLMADGELIGHTPATIRCLPGAIELLR